MVDKEYRKDFPLINTGEGIYFDNAATVQRPLCVIEALEDTMARCNANPLRGLYALSVKATSLYEGARDKVAKFLGASSSESIVFTRNTTESINLAAYTWGLEHIGAGDEIVLSIAEHHSNLLPWQMVARLRGAKLVFLEPHNGVIDEEQCQEKIGPATKLVAIAAVSNVLGVIAPIDAIVKRAHSVGARVLVDAAQAVPHTRVKVGDIDFLAFSGHKLGAPMGIGVLYAKSELLKAMPPFLRGGEMIEYVSKESATWAQLPHKFEAGTVNLNGAVGLGAAIAYIEAVGYEYIGQKDALLVGHMLEGMEKIPHVNVVGRKEPALHCGIVTFTIDGVHPHDIASMLDSENVAIRAGHHCAQPLMEYLGLQSTARASVWLYNTMEEVDVFLDKLAHIREWSGYGD